MSEQPSHDLRPEKWEIIEYDPGITVGQWIELLDNQKVFNSESLEIMKRIKDHGGMATCKQLSDKYGETYHFYRIKSVALARRVAKETGASIYRNEKGEWPFQILYLGRRAEKNESGSYVWKLRKELSLALDQVDLSNVTLYSKYPPDEELVNMSPVMSPIDIKKAATFYAKEHPIQYSATVKQYHRSKWVKENAKTRASGYCQLCNEKAPFIDKDGMPYLEVHHIIWLAQGGADTPENTVALCPNCHRKMHILYGEDSNKRDIEYLTKIAQK